MSSSEQTRRTGPGSFKRLSGAIFLLGLGAAFSGAHAEEATLPVIKGVLKAGSKLEFIKEGFKGTEGPIGLADGSLLFTETQDNRITRIAPDGSVSSYLENSNGSNGLGFTPAGDIVSVQVLNPKVGIIYPKEHERVLADAYEGVPFARPNDLVVSKRGDVYFTDSGQTRTEANAAPVPPRPALYQITAAGKLLRIANDIERPNGIQLSPDEKVLYVANTGGEYVLAYDVAKDGSVSGRRNFAKLEGFTTTDTGPSSGADGLAVDAKGRLYAASNTGIQIFSKSGEALGTIPLPRKPQNIAFAGKDKKTLYVVGRGAVYRLALETPGYAGRAK